MGMLLDKILRNNKSKNMENEDISLVDIFNAKNNIASSIVKTPLRLSEILSSENHKVYLKLESHQITGSFKLRGASNAIAQLVRNAKINNKTIAGVVGVSTGNHGKGLAYAASKANVPSYICMSTLVPENKVEGIKKCGAKVVIDGSSQDEAQIIADALALKDNLAMLPPFDHKDVIAGQGTVALEIMEDLANVDNVIVPLSGGGLLSGIALTMKSINPKIKVIGVTMERGCAMYQSQRAGKPILVEELETLADSLGGGIGLDNKYTFAMVDKYVDELLLVNEEDIAKAISHAYWNEQEVIEGSGSVGIACVMKDMLSLTGNTVIVVSGKNIDMQLHHKIINENKL